MEIKSFTSGDLCSHMYLLLENGRALVIDPSREEAAFRLIEESAASVDRILLTHEHCDHCAGAEALREKYRCPILASKPCARGLGDARMNYSHYFKALCTVQTKLNAAKGTVHMEDFILAPDEVFEGERLFTWQGHSLFLKETPGHTPGSICILLDDAHLFSGDTLLWGEKTITRFTGGSKRQLVNDTIPWLQSINPEAWVYPGHLEQFRLKDRLTTSII